MRRRLVHFLVRMYPLAWRERYEFEILGLFEDEEPTWSDIADIGRAIVRERVKATIESVFGSTDSRLRFLRLRHVARFVLSLLLGLTIATIGTIAAILFVSPSKSWPVSASFISFLYSLPLVRACLPHLGFSVKNWPNAFNRRFAIGRRELLVWLVFDLALTTLHAATVVARGYRSPWEDIMQPVLWVVILFSATTGRLADHEETRLIRLNEIRRDVSQRL